MNKSVPWMLAMAAPLLPIFTTAGFCGGSPFVQARADEAARKKRDSDSKPKDPPKEKPPVQPSRPSFGGSNSGIDPNPVVRRPRDSDRDDVINRPLPPRDHDHDHDRDHDYHRNTPVIINRPVYVPTYPTGSYPYPYPTGPYPTYPTGPYPYPYPYVDPVGEREDALLEVVGKQMRFALRENEILKPFKLDTDTVGDSIEIHGTVDTIEQLQLALDVARNIDPKTRIVVTRIKIRQRQ